MPKYSHNLSLTTVLRYINEHLGASVQEFELSEQNMMNIVIQQTIPTFSMYFPFAPYIRIDETCKVPGKMNEYYIPNKYNLTILTVTRIISNNIGLYGISGSVGYIPIGDPITAQVNADAASATILEPLFEFIPPNIIRIKTNGVVRPVAGYLIQVQAIHPNHLKTIGANYRDIFCELAYADVLTALYSIRNRFSQLNTPYGTLTTFMDEINNARQRRDDAIQKLEQNYLYSADVKRIWIG